MALPNLTFDVHTIAQVQSQTLAALANLVQVLGHINQSLTHLVPLSDRIEGLGIAVDELRGEIGNLARDTHVIALTTTRIADVLNPPSPPITGIEIVPGTPSPRNS